MENTQRFTPVNPPQQQLTEPTDTRKKEEFNLPKLALSSLALSSMGRLPTYFISISRFFTGPKSSPTVLEPKKVANDIKLVKDTFKSNSTQKLEVPPGVKTLQWIKGSPPPQEATSKTKILDTISDNTKERLNSAVEIAENPESTEDEKRQSVVLLEVDNTAQEKLQAKYVTSGKVKDVYKTKEGRILFSYVKGEGISDKLLFNFLRKRELQQETTITPDKIKDNLIKAGILSEEIIINSDAKKNNAEKLENLGIDFKVVTKEEKKNIDFTDVTEKGKKIGDKFTVDTSDKGDDLEKRIRGLKGKPLSFTDCITLGGGMLKGLSLLHAAGFVHGDLKPENIMAKGNTAIVTDFGKSVAIGDKEDVLFMGNPRFGSLEGKKLNKQAEVSSAGYMLIRMLEEQVLKGRETLLDPKDNSVNPVPILGNPDKVDAKTRRGFEKFLIESKDCPQSEQTIKGQIKLFKHTVKLAILPKYDVSKAETAINNYINQLTLELELKNPQLKDDINELNLLLKNMTQANSKERCTMETASVTYSTIMASIARKQPKPTAG